MPADGEQLEPITATGAHIVPKKLATLSSDVKVAMLEHWFPYPLPPPENTIALPDCVFELLTAKVILKWDVIAALSVFVNSIVEAQVHAGGLRKTHVD